MIAKKSSAAVGAKLLIASMTAPATPSSTTSATPNCTATIPKTTGTRISPTTGVSRLLRIKYMNTAIMTKPRTMSIGAPLVNDC